MGNKVAGMFSCGQRDLCHLSEAQPQAGNKVRSKIWDKEKEQHKQEMGQLERGRNNAWQEQALAYVTENHDVFAAAR